MKALTLSLLFAAPLLPLAALAQNPAQVMQSRQTTARPLPLDAVRLISGPLKISQDLEDKYLLELQPDRMLAYLRRQAGLKPKAEGYGGWDGDGRQLTGHIAGHYLSGISLAYAATGDKRFKDRVDYMVSEMHEIQKAQGDGYIGALMDKDSHDGKKHFEDLRKGVIDSGGFDLNGLWSPWYVQHKIFAGLRDAYRYTGNKQALETEIGLAAWTESIVGQLSDEQIQKMLNTEFGGMNEVLADLYADTGDSRWLRLSDRFEHHSIVDLLAQHKDILPGKHGNTQVPKLYGDLIRSLYTGNQHDGEAARYFFDEVTGHHTFATGGHGKNEYFGKPDLLDEIVDGRTAETCNVYNMLKMARTLFSMNQEIRYADFHERALFNHILASQSTIDGRVSYMVPVGRGNQHEYQGKFEDFTCCVGTAMESLNLHGYGIYFESGDKLWVSLYAPTTANWKEAGVQLTTSTDFPIGDSAQIKLTVATPHEFTLALRRPYWAAAGFTVKVNGKAVQELTAPDTYISLKRTWKTGDVVELTMPKQLHVEPLTDNPSRVALMWGPLVLAGDLGHEFESEEEYNKAEPAPALIADKSAPESFLVPVADEPGHFRTHNAGLKQDVDFRPFYQLSNRRYAIYWDVFSAAEWKLRADEYAATEARKRKLEAATVAFAQPGQMQSERDFNEQGEETTPTQLEGHYGRQGKWFSFDLPVDPSHPLNLIVTTSNESWGSSHYAILADGTRLGEQTIHGKSPEEALRFDEVSYQIPSALVAGKKKITIRFEGIEGKPVNGIFGIRITRADVQ